MFNSSLHDYRPNWTTRSPFPILHFRVLPGLSIKTRLSAQPLIWKWFFILIQVKLNSTRKVVHLASFWKWGLLSYRYNKICDIFYFFVKVKHKKLPEIFASSEKKKNKQTNNNSNNNYRKTTKKTIQVRAMGLSNTQVSWPVLNAKIRTGDSQSDLIVIVMIKEKKHLKRELNRLTTSSSFLCSLWRHGSRQMSRVSTILQRLPEYQITMSFDL